MTYSGPPCVGSRAIPIPRTREALQTLVDAGDRDGLADAMGEPLTFGTAGIRGEVGPGSGRMNRATVIRTTRGLADYLIAKHGVRQSGRWRWGTTPGPTAAPSPRTPQAFWPRPAFGSGSSRRSRPHRWWRSPPSTSTAPAAVVITASHNPPADNGYKVYDGNAAQIIPPTDAEIAAAIAGVGPATDVPRIEGVFAGGSELVTPMPDDILDAYKGELASARPNAQTSDLKIVYTPLHGVGGETLVRLCAWANHNGLYPGAGAGPA